MNWPGDPSPGADGVPLRLCGGLHALVRAGGAPALAACFPPNPLPAAETLWQAVAPALAEPGLPAWLERAPQTNEVGRSAVLMAGLLALCAEVRRPLELLELGASAGLNLILDRYRYQLGDVSTGDTDSPLLLAPAWQGPPPPAGTVEIVDRAGVDVQPVDARRDRDRLLAYVFPDHRQRLARLESALGIAAQHPPIVEQGDAADWLEQRLALPRAAGTTRVVLHSVAFQYFPEEAQRRIERAMAQAGANDPPLAWLRFEKLPDDSEFSLRLRLWPDGGDRLLAWCQPHGAKLHWLAPAGP